MNIGIVYYSFTGNTRRSCLFLKEQLMAKGYSVVCIDLRPAHETTTFVKQCCQAAFKRLPQLLECDYDVGRYDMVIFASPVWAFSPAPPLNTYLQNIKNLSGKRAACFLTFGSGVGAQRALNNLEERIRRKQGRLLFSKNISSEQTKHRRYLIEQFKTLLELCED